MSLADGVPLRTEEGKKETTAQTARSLDDKFHAYAENLLAKLRSDIDRSNAQDEQTDRTIRYVTCCLNTYPL